MRKTRTENDLYRWRMQHHISLLRAELILGVSRVTLLKYERGGNVTDLVKYKIDHRQESLETARKEGRDGV